MGSFNLIHRPLSSLIMSNRASGFTGRGRGRGRGRIFNVRIEKLEKRSANERLFRSRSSEECEATDSTESNNNISNASGSSSNAGTSKSDTTPIPVIYESCIPPPESSLTMRLKKAWMGKTSMDKSAGGDLECVCFRPLKKIVCRICGKMIIGRVRRLCAAHPKHIWLLDVSACPRCQVNPMWLQEHDLRDDEPVPANARIDEVSE